MTTDPEAKRMPDTKTGLPGDEELRETGDRAEQMTDYTEVVERAKEVLASPSNTSTICISAVKELAAAVVKMATALEEFRLWLCEDLDRACGLGAIMDDPPTTCLT